MANTEKPTTITEKKRQGIVSTGLKDGLKKSTIDSELNKGTKDGLTDKKISELTGEAKISEEKPKEEKKKTIVKIKKTEAIVNGKDLPVSTKESMAVCKFVKNKKIQDAIADLERVVVGKKAVPMKGEIPHRKGKIMSGRFPKKTSEHFIKLLKNLSANATVGGLENPVIVEAVANFASRPFGRFGSVRRKRTHVKIKCKEKIKNETK